MQNKKSIECFNLSVPLELFEEAGLEPDGLIEMQAKNGRIIFTKPDCIDDFVCDGDCVDCPIELARCSNKRRKGLLNVRCKKV